VLAADLAARRNAILAVQRGLSERLHPVLLLRANDLVLSAK